MISVVIPARNEAANLRVLLPRLHRVLTDAGRPFEVFVIDSASTDETARVVGEFEGSMPELRLIRVSQSGYGRAVLAGFAAARGDVLATLRGDNQERPEDLCRLIELRERQNLDLCKAVRQNRFAEEGWQRVVVSFVFNALFKMLFRTRSADVNGSPKVLSRAFYESVKWESQDWFIDAEIVIRAERAGVRIGSLPIAYQARLEGRSTAHVGTVFEFLGNMLRWRRRLATERPLA